MVVDRPQPKPGQKIPLLPKASDVEQAIVNAIKVKSITLPFGKSYSIINDRTTLLNDLIKANQSDFNKIKAMIPAGKQFSDYIKFKQTTPPTTIPMISSTPKTVNIRVDVAGVTSADIPIQYQVTNTWTQIGGETNLPKDVRIRFAPTLINGNYYVGTQLNGLWKSDGTDLTKWTQIGARSGNIPTNTFMDLPPTLINGNYYLGTFAAGLWKSDGTN